MPIARQQFPLGVVAGSLATVLEGGTPLRRVPAVEAMAWKRGGIERGSPAAIRCGCGCCDWACTT